MRTPFIAPIAIALALVVVAAGNAQAQAVPGGTFSPPTNADPLNDPNPAPATVGTGATRLNGRTRQARTPLAPTPPSAEELQIAAQAVASGAGLDCQVTEAISPGVTAEQARTFEAACATGPGYILIASAPPQSFDCLELAGTAYTARLRDPAADVGQQCVLPANQNGLAVIGGWAREAGAACTIDEAVAIGKSDQNNIVYEVGCAGVDGYWLEKVATGWKLQDCLQVASVGGACRFTTAKEQADGFEPKLAGTEASACDVSQVRLMGSNANGRFYEAKCAAAGEGFIARVNNEGATQQIYPCATAQRIGGGCTLTPAAAPEAAPAE